MSLTPSDMLKIQSAIDAYERKYPHRPSPTAAEALAWQANKGKVKLQLVDRAAEEQVQASGWQSLFSWRRRKAILQA